ncbi:type I-E CRISPR-associated protein Cse1/CasA [Streptomyces sp. NPDC002490]|uniref:type I-E CRISPR-associated protein Cse1/CasA n=1 Tax=Streptomyces sp. NPDC002490 TaxID=3154416 RepID=UPI003318FEB9
MPVVSLDGEFVELPLVDLLSRADQLSALSCDTPGEGVALLDYLLAICFAAGFCPRPEEDWKAWLAEGHGFGEVAEWLAHEPADDWDLFHPERPLGQNALLAPYLDEHGTGPAQLVVERAGDYNQFLDHHHLEHPAPLPANVAFRAMLCQHVYGLSGRARLPGSLLGPKLTNLSTGRLLGRIRVVVQGRTLGDTLRLNLYPAATAGRFNHSWTTGSVQRRGFTTKPPGRRTSGPADLHSYLGRSVLLRPVPPEQGGGPVMVDRVLVGAGELLELDPARDLEDAVPSKKVLNGHAKPLWPSPTRALWRDAHALYSAAKDGTTGLFGRLRHLEFPEEGGGPPCTLWAVGLIANKTLAVAWTEGSFPYAPSQGEALCEASRRGSEIVDRLAGGLERAAYVAWKITYPNPKPTDRPAQQARFDARREFWPEAEGHFDVLLDEVARGYDGPPALLRYATQLRYQAEEFLNHRLDSLPDNGPGMRARGQAKVCFHKHVTSAEAPAELRGETHR